MGVYLGVTAEATALLIVTAHSSSSSPSKARCVTVSPLAISPADTSSLVFCCSRLAAVTYRGHGTSWAARFWITCSHQRDIFGLLDLEKIMYPWATEQGKRWHFRIVGTNPCPATGSLSSRHSRSPVILIWLLYSSNPFLPPWVPAAPCTALHPYGPCQIASLSSR